MESNLEALCGVLVGEMASLSDHILTTVTKWYAPTPLTLHTPSHPDCSVVNSREKVLVYSALVGLLNARKFEAGELVLDLVLAELRNSLALPQYDTARHLVRPHPLTGAPPITSTSLYR